MSLSIPHRSAKALVALGLTTMLAACVTNEELGNPEGWEPVLPQKDPAIAALVPDKIAQRGSITVGANTPYAPSQFKDSNGNIIGYEVDLIKAAGSVLGLDVTVRQMDFSLILPAISAGTLDAGASAFTDTEERQENYDFVDFFNFGSAWATQPGNEGNVDPANACGMTVAVQKGTYSDTDEVQGKSDDCVAQGKEPINKLVYATADAAANATILKRAEAYSSDSPVISYAVTRSEGRLVQAGELFDEAQFGWAVDKGAPLGPALAAALQKLIDTGDYERILQPWGLEEGAIDAVTFNLQPFTVPTANNSTNPRIARRKKA
ncbi:Glutamine-binding periplasmic protein precursor [Corynebacterium urogenitale]|uniref:Glutamine-binding periplasmic protein n=1 Tax=Corynebacterium urogenitale TaxID=2487892 RepID=A0A5J6Z768_9CORY|nr:ABC transporter substrate-binding protein [Corynebacterium urogenitale]QFQ02211.1 Glutamine-binding periplasmic protein precursor [Corynebacterium urogenitale]